MAIDSGNVNAVLQAAKLEELVPRQYQEEVFSRAQKGNIIAALDTGSGKTLISLLLIKWIASLEKTKEKAIIFLVPKVTLVEQQYSYIKRNSTLKVGKLHGAQDLDLSDRTGWKRRLESCDVIVMTAQIFLNILTHSLWTMEKVALMIFDECHHARKNHPYNAILREYSYCPTVSRPKVFGMTASPIWNIKDPVGSLTVLEANLDAKVTAVREHVEELAVYSPKALEFIKEFPPPPETFDDYPSPTIYQCFKVIDQRTWGQLDIPWTNIDLRYQVTLSNIGPYCASMFLYLEIQHHIMGIIAETKGKLLEDDDETRMEGVLWSSVSSPKALPQEFYLIMDILLEFHSCFPTDITSTTVPIPIPLDWCTPKVKVLVEILLAYLGRSPTFQCIIFVEQRQVASSLSKILPAIPELTDNIFCAFLVGEGVNSEGASTQTNKHYGDPVKLFRDRKINVLIATSVAEEGLDFQECDLVVRFDGLHHMVGYVQSRGRARKSDSTFIIMVQQDDNAQLKKYHDLKTKEPEVKHVYRTRHMAVDDKESDGDQTDSDEETDPTDLLARERYLVPSTGATLTYDNSLSLLNHLCSLIPRDAFTQVHKPKYTGDFEATVHLPRVLPVSAAELNFTGPIRRSKKEAKRAAAFKAVKRLRELDVFDEYLLPTSKDEGEEVVKYSAGKISQIIPQMMTIDVRDPWCIGEKLWLHTIVIDSEAAAGLVTGTPIAPEETKIGGFPVQTLPAKLLRFDEDLEHEQRAAMQEFTKLGIWCNINAKKITGPLSLYMVPITPDHQPDFEAIQVLLANPRGIDDWSGISEEHCNKLIVLSKNQYYRAFLLRSIRPELTPMSHRLSGSLDSTGQTYFDHWVEVWPMNRKWVVPTDGAILEVTPLLRSNMGTYSLDTNSEPTDTVLSVTSNRFLPQKSSPWFPMSYSVRRAYEIMPVLCHRITNVYRASCARHELKLPSIPTSLMIESFTIPSASMPFNNQRLETLGDAVLQLCTTIHLLNQYPNRHEGQLTALRQLHVSNKYLLRRALDLGLERYVNTEIPSIRRGWRYILSVTGSSEGAGPDTRSISRQYPRRSLQDCMEALLGASFVAGGVSLALYTGTALGLEFGGSIPWFMRYSQIYNPAPITSLFTGLEEALGYIFHYNHLVLESLTHPSFTNSEVPSYQRLEFLGDAIIELVVMKYLFDKFPHATSHQLSLSRARAICSPTLAYLTVKRLGLHKMMLVNSMALSQALNVYVPLFEGLSGKEVVKASWKYDPPKALSDVFESIIGAVLVDSGYDYEKTAAVVEYVMDDVLEALSPAVQKDPVSELTEWLAGSGCRSLHFEKRVKETDPHGLEGVVAIVHGNLIVGPIISATPQVAKFVAAERALAILKDSESDKSLSCLCNCASVMDVVSTADVNKGFSKLSIDSAVGDPSDGEDEDEVTGILVQVEDKVVN
ncbi:hypothetical protein CPB84DRAFT_1791372 [Gymnopilus junonius]|uniref:Dicer-like protein 1 n=1 Tax=Gymnopilus junonius TaxID=109634 RepID=A0A9P5TIZ4_GYMJU|nr:hypothetical protein CPB84DRAFT_1791372 [Gymnopilus junonius]